MTRRSPRPPLRRCGACGGDYASFADRGCCPRCLREQAAGAAEEARRLREARRQERLDSLEGNPPPPYGVIPF